MSKALWDFGDKMKLSILCNSYFNELSKPSKKQRILFCFLALLSAVFLYVIYFITVKYAFDFSFDEPFPLSICERLFSGDKLIIDEWALPQFSAIFQYLPFYCFRKITGSTQGIVLFMRCVYIGTNILTYGYILLRYRKRPWVALTTAFLFCSFVPLCVCLLGYYYLPLIFMFAFATIIIDEDAVFRPARLVIAGILLSGTVILNPGSAFLWLAYCLFVLLRAFAKKKGKNTFADYAFLLDTKTFKYLLFGVLLSAVVFLFYCLKSSGFKVLFSSISSLAMDTDGSHFHHVLTGSNLFHHIQETIQKYGIFFYLTFFETIGLIALRVIRKKKPLKHPDQQTGFFIVSLVFVLTYFSFFISHFHPMRPILMESPIFIAWFGLNCCLLCERKHPKLFFFWLVGATLSITQDLISEATNGIGFAVCILPTILLTHQLIDELTSAESTQSKKKKRKQIPSGTKNLHLFRLAIALILTVSFAWGIINVCEFSYFYRKHPLDEKRFVIEEGPYKGLSMPENYVELYSDLISDLKIAKSISDKPVCIMGLYPVGYLYLERRINVPSPGSSYDEANERYWRLYPEKRPCVVYIPFLDEYETPKITKEQFDLLENGQLVDFDWFVGKVTKGKLGIIVEVSKWNEQYPPTLRLSD